MVTLYMEISRVIDNFDSFFEKLQQHVKHNTKTNNR